MGAPSSDRAGIRQIIRALVKDGYSLVMVHDGEDEVYVRNETQAIDAIMAVDIAHLFVKSPTGDRGYVFFVLGNAPDEVAADWTLNLDDTLSPLTESWW